MFRSFRKAKTSYLAFKLLDSKSREDLHNLNYPPNGHGSHAVGKDGEERGGCVCVIGPALPRGAPQFEDITQADGAHKGQYSSPVVGGADGDQHTGDDRQNGLGFVHCRPYKGYHGGQKNREDDPVQHDPQLARVLGQRDTQKAHNPVDG